MSRIISTTGDIKRGRQGEQVYQLKDGRQMRRLASRKSGIISKTQNRQRGLFQKALAWRKSLTLDERRALESLAYQHKARGDDGFILPWSMFALRIYLARPTFTLVKTG